MPQFSSETAKVGEIRNDSNLPDAVTRLVNLALDPMFDAPTPGDTGVMQTGAAGLNTQAPSMDFRMQPSYKEGGMIGPGGMPQRPNGARPGLAPPSAAPGGVSSQAMQAEIQRMMQQHPDKIAQIKQAMMQALQSGELTPQELNMMQQLAMAAAQNPQLYPQLRQFAIKQGLGTEQDIPPQYDQSMLFVVILAAQSLHADTGGQNVLQGGSAQQAGLSIPQASMQHPQGAYKDGGALPQKARNKDGSVPITAHEGEYVVPAHVVRAKGTDFFDKMIENYNPDGSNASKA